MLALELIVLNVGTHLCSMAPIRVQVQQSF